jgi:hypothetical protein
MAGMAKVYEREPDQPLLDAYWLTLGDWSLAEFEASAAQLMRTSKFMPRPADFVELRRQARGKTAAEAWFTSGESADPRARRAMRIAAQGRYVGHIPTDELPWVQKRFLEVYDELQDVEESRDALAAGPDWLQLQSKAAAVLKGPAA